MRRRKEEGEGGGRNARMSETIWWCDGFALWGDIVVDEEMMETTVRSLIVCLARDVLREMTATNLDGDMFQV